MALRVTRPGFIRGIQALAASDAPVPALPSDRAVARGRARRSRTTRTATPRRNEMRSFVCGQCHVEYYCSSKMPLTFPVGQGPQRRATSRRSGTRPSFPTASRSTTTRTPRPGAHVLKAQHPEFELWNQGIHARSGVACADCHMPYMREGASKVSDHWVRSPLLNVNRACQTCHRSSEDEMKARVDVIQQRNYELLQRGGAAHRGPARRDRRREGRRRARRSSSRRRSQLQRKAQWRLDFIAAENSMGFHAPQEAARVLGEAIDYARQGQIALLGGVTTSAAATPAPGAVVPSASATPPAAPLPSASTKP